MSTTEPATSRTILRVDSGADHPASVSRGLADQLIARLATNGTTVVRRDVSGGLPTVDHHWVAAEYGGVDNGALGFSDELVDELLASDELVLVAPVYNFGVPAAMKSWIDQVARVGRTFRFTENGPEGLVDIERAWIVTASGGTSLGGPSDFNTPYLHAVLEFLGVREIRVIGAGQLRFSGDAAVAQAYRDLDAALDE